LALSRNWPIHQLDVKNAFLNGDLFETIHMYQPPGFVDLRFPHHVCQLQRSLYGLKQAPRAWFQRFAGYALRYAMELLDQAHMASCNPTWTPIDTESKLGADGDPVFDPTLYRSLAAKQQHTLSRSSVEAEYRGVANVVAETAWLHNLL
ncbi:ribonuclease H-like domain-containing protein, partial [Tanacetum coccineum]